MKLAITLTAAFLSTLASAHGNDTTHSHDMGSASFLWPAPRPWSESTDQMPPCGSTAGITNRTSFPLTNGRLALVSQNDTRALSVGVSYANNPQTLNDFQIRLGPKQFGDLEVGHTCIKTLDPPQSVVAGSNATWMLRYTDEKTGEVEYACADIVFVEAAAFTSKVPCFNATAESDGPQVDGGVNATTVKADGVDLDFDRGGDDDEMSAGAIAGVVVGVVVGVPMIVCLVLYVGGHRKRSRARAT